MKTVDAIMKEIATLPYKGQRELADRLRRNHLDHHATSEQAERLLPEKRWEQLRNNILANGGTDINRPDKERPAVEARMAAIAQMRYEGYSRSEVAQAAHKTAATIRHAEMNIEAAMSYPGGFRLFTSLWGAIHTEQ
jgi:vancomycin resistance protein YoaR